MKCMKSKTAVEWLRKELKSMDTKYYNSLIQIEMDRDNFIQICEQAKEMEKQQIIKARTDIYITGNLSAEEYYNETYKDKL